MPMLIIKVTLSQIQGSKLNRRTKGQFMQLGAQLNIFSIEEQLVEPKVIYLVTLKSPCLIQNLALQIFVIIFESG